MVKFYTGFGKNGLVVSGERDLINFWAELLKSSLVVCGERLQLQRGGTSVAGHTPLRSLWHTYGTSCGERAPWLGYECYSVLRGSWLHV